MVALEAVDALVAQLDQYTDLFLSSPEAQVQDGCHSGDPHCSGMAQVNVLLKPGRTPDRGSKSTARSSGFSVPKNDLPFCFTVTGFNCIAVKAQIWRDRGISESVITTML